MNRDQLKYLKGLLRSTYIKTRNRVCDDPKKPKHVRAAEQVVKAWRDAVQKDRYDCMEKLDQANESAMQEILFGDADAALKAIKAVERFQP